MTDRRDAHWYSIRYDIHYHSCSDIIYNKKIIMNLYVRIFLIVLIIVSVAFVGITDMMTNTIGDAAW